MGKRVDIAGKTFSNLTVLQFAGKTSDGHAQWEARCSCGTVITALGRNLRSGSTSSCGCQTAALIGASIRTHGATSRLASTGLRRAHGRWKGMLSRCYNPEHSRYARYGGRGIKVCDAWRSSFATFLSDMGLPPVGMTIDRENNNGDYTKDNCRWANAMQQAANTSIVKIVSTPGGPLHLAEAIRRFSGVKSSTVYSRLRRGWSAEAAVFGPYVPYKERKWK